MIYCNNKSILGQAPSHLRGFECNKCSKNGFDPDKAGHLYVLRSDDYHLDIIKIGISNKPLNRIKHLRRVTGFEFRVINSVYFELGVDAFDIETQLKCFAKYLGLGVDFGRKFNGYTEWFHLNEEFLNCMNSLIEKKISNQVKLNIFSRHDEITHSLKT